MNESFNIHYAAGKVIAVLHKTFANASDKDIAGILEGIPYEKAEVIYHASRTAAGNGAGDILLIELINKDKSAVIDAIELLSAKQSVLYAEPDYEEELHLVPNDPLYSQLWGTLRIGAPKAWEYTTGQPGVSVGVIDTGIDYRHPDIAENMWASYNRQLQNGWNFAANDSHSIDTDGHGTHVAGTVGAVGNNGIGITGICWNVKTVSLKFGLDVASAVAAIDFANYFNIPILNASWGGRYYSWALKLAIEEYEGLFIASAGNNGSNNDFEPIYPASYDSGNIISVAATNPNNELAGFSNYGVRNVDIAAPGTEILSLGLNGEYSTQNGTSMAAPHVAGAAALLKSFYPSLSAKESKRIILSSAVRHPSLTGKVLTGGILNVNDMFALASDVLSP